MVNCFQQRLWAFNTFMALLGILFSTVSVAEVSEPLIMDDNALFVQAVELSDQKQWDQAELIYRDLLKRNKQWPEPGNNLAILLLKTNRVDEAKKLLEQAVSSGPSYRIAQLNRSLLYNYLATQAYDKALGSNQYIEMPELKLIKTIYQPVKIIEKEVEKIIIEKEFVEKIVLSDQHLTTQKNIHDQLRRQLSGWSHAWSEGDFKQYMASYSENFTPSDRQKSYLQWKNIRRARLKFTKGVNVEIDQLRVFVEPDNEYALVEFVQRYHSDSYADTVLKQLYMFKQHESWLILSERTIKKY